MNVSIFKETSQWLEKIKKNIFKNEKECILVSRLKLMDVTQNI